MKTKRGATLLKIYDITAVVVALGLAGVFLVKGEWALTAFMAVVSGIAYIFVRDKKD